MADSPAGRARRAKARGTSLTLTEARDRPGISMKGGRYPIRNLRDARNARRAIGRTPPAQRPAVMAHIRKREKTLGISAKKPALARGR